jgi:hypothetical protein
MATTLTLASIWKMAPQDVIAGFSADEKVAFDKIAGEFREKEKRDRLWFWDRGKEAAGLLEKQRLDPDKQIWKAFLLERFSRALGYGTVKVLQTAVNISRAWPTKKLFNEMLKLEGPAGTKLSVTHLGHLSVVKDSKMRMAIALESLQDGWPCATLHGHIQDRWGSNGHTAGGRPVSKPGSAMACVNHMGLTSAKMNKLFSDAWLSKDFDLKVEFQQTPSSQCTDATVEKLSETREAMRGLQAWLSQGQQVLLECEEVVKRRVEGQDVDTAAEAEAAEAPEAGATGETLQDAKRRQTKAEKKKNPPKKKKRSGRVGVGAGA